MIYEKLTKHMRGMRKYWFIISEVKYVDAIINEAKNNNMNLRIKKEAESYFHSIDFNNLIKNMKESLIGDKRGWIESAMNPEEAEVIINEIIDAVGEINSCYSNNSSNENGINEWNSIWENEENYVFEDAYIIIGCDKSAFLFIVEND